VGKLSRKTDMSLFHWNDLTLTIKALYSFEISVTIQ